MNPLGLEELDSLFKKVRNHVELCAALGRNICLKTRINEFNERLHQVGSPRRAITRGKSPTFLHLSQEGILGASVQPQKLAG
jgi:hypothetical protein